MFADKSRIGHMIFAGLLVAATACNDLPTEAGPASVTHDFHLAGEYETAIRAGGPGGTWRVAERVQITADRRVLVNDFEIINPQVDDNAVTWSMEDGNTSNASLEFITDIDSDALGNVMLPRRQFQGWIQHSGEDRLDYHGVAR
jgi:hypothetical protein